MQGEVTRLFLTVEGVRRSNWGDSVRRPAGRRQRAWRLPVPEASAEGANAGSGPRRLPGAGGRSSPRSRSPRRVGDTRASEARVLVGTGGAFVLRSSLGGGRFPARPSGDPPVPSSCPPDGLSSGACRERGTGPRPRSSLIRWLPRFPFPLPRGLRGVQRVGTPPDPS